MPKNTDQDQTEKRYQLLQQLKPIIWKYEAKQVITEGIYSNRNMSTFRKLAQMQGAVQDWCRNNEILCFSWANAGQWRAILGLNGKNRDEDKILVKKFVIEMYGLPDDTSDDVCDAIGSCLAYFQMLEQKGIK